jgi:hypothetical protein
MTSKNLFNKQKDLRSYLNAVVKNEEFLNCLIYVRGELMEAPNLKPEHLEGAKRFQDILTSFTDEEPEAGDFPKPILHHDLDHIVKNADKPK